MNDAQEAPKGGVVRTSERVMNLSHFLRTSGRRLSDQVGLVCGERAWTWSELDARVDAMATALDIAGVRKGDRILVQSRNCNQMFESMFVSFRLGAVWVPTNYRQTPSEFADLAHASGAAAMICHADFPDHAAAATAASPAIRTVVAIGASSMGDAYDVLVDRHLGRAFPTIDVEHNDPCWFFFTSGTTGRPKAAVLTHGQMGFVATNHLSDLMPGMTPEGDASLVVAPLSHGAGVHQLVQVARGVKTVLLSQERFDPDEVWRLVERWRITNMFTVPTIVKILTEYPGIDAYDHSSLKYVIYAGAPMYRPDQKHAVKKLGKVLVQYFGLGEVTGNITVLPSNLHDEDDIPGLPLGSCGYERTAMQISIQNENGDELAPFENGEICVCGLAVFPGYYANPEANANAFRNGWFRTGDLGYQDAAGLLYITGRASDMYISGGSNVYPVEVEEKILTHPAIAEVVVFGVPDLQWGEVGVAVAVIRQGRCCDQAELLRHLDGKISRYKFPKHIVFWESLPRSAYGKLSKKVVREELAARGDLGQWLAG